MHPFKGIISHYKWTWTDIKGIIPIYIYLYTNIYALTLIWSYSYIIKEFVKSHSLTALLDWDWVQRSEEYSSVQSLVQQYKSPNCTPMGVLTGLGQAKPSSLGGNLSETRLSCLLSTSYFLPSSVHRSPSTVYHILSTIWCLLFSFIWFVFILTLSWNRA